MKNPGQHNPAFRTYTDTIAASAKKVYQKASQSSIKDGAARRKVDDLMEKRRLNRELDLWD